MKEKVGFIGLGAMGVPMSQRLLEAGYSLVVYDVRKEAIETIVKKGAQGASSPREVAEKCRKVITIVPNSDAVEQVVFGPGGLLEGMKAGDILIEMTSSYPPSTLKVNQALSAKGVHMIDAPVSGGVVGAVAGTLSVMVGGDEKIFESCRPILSVMGKNLFYIGGIGFGHALKAINNFLSVMGKNLFYIGGIGFGHALKAINNFLSATTLAATSEAIILASKMGISPQRAIEVLAVSTGRSYTTELKFPKFVLPRTFNSGFTLELMHKDLNTVTRMAREYKIPMLMANLVQELYGYSLAHGDKKTDHTAIFSSLEELAGTNVKA